MIILFTTYIYLLCNGDNKLVNRCSREHATITSCCNFKGIYLRKKKWYKMKTPQFGQKRQAPKPRLQGLATKRVVRESRKEVLVVTTGQPHRGVAHGTKAPSQRGITNQRRRNTKFQPNRCCNLVLTGSFNLLNLSEHLGNR